MTRNRRGRYGLSVALLMCGLGAFAFAGGAARAGTGSSAGTNTSTGAGTDTATGQPAGVTRTGPDSSKATNAPAAPVAVEEERLVTGPFWVDSVNRSDRTVVVRSADGSQMTIDVAPNATGFDSLKRGDRVNLDYFRAAVVGLAPSPAPASANANGSGNGNASSRASASAAPMQGGSGDVSRRQTTASVRLTDVDAQRGTIQFTNAAGKPQTLQVRDPALRQRLGDLRPGDRVDVTYTVPVAMSIRPSSAMK